MKKFSLVLLALFCFQAQAIRTLSFDERKLETEFDRLALQEKWTFATDVTAVGNPEYGKGYLGPSLDLPFVDFDPSVDVYSVDLRDKTKFKVIRNQGSCGSCVVFAVNGAWTITMQLRNLVFPDLSEGHLMNCGGNGGQCNGDYGDRVSERLDKLQTLFPLSVYPYVTSSGSCKESRYSGPRYGKISEFKNVGTSVRELGAALNSGYAVAGGVAADRYYQAYRGGVYNPQNSSSSVNRFNDKVYDDRVALSPAVNTLEGVVGTPYSVYQAIANDGSKKRAVKDVLSAIGVLTGYPAGALSRPIGYGIDVYEGDAEPTGPIDFTRGLVTGRR